MLHSFGCRREFAIIPQWVAEMWEWCGELAEAGGSESSHWVALELRQVPCSSALPSAIPPPDQSLGSCFIDFSLEQDRVCSEVLRDLASAWIPKTWELILRTGLSPCDSQSLNRTSVLFLHQETIVRVTVLAVKEVFEDPECYVYT